MGNWFGNLQLAYKYTVVFVSLLAFTLIAGFIKVFFDRRRLKKLTQQQNEEAGPREEQMELNRREKDEGDLFGIRAIEAGFYAGIPQSRPTSRAGSFVNSPSMSSSTLVGGLNSPKIQSHSMSSSIASLPLAHTRGDSDVVPSLSPQRRKSPPSALKLRPSEAELSGRINHNAAVNMGLNVPPSPVRTSPHHSPTFGGSDSGESDNSQIPRSPRSPGYKPEHYAPLPPRIPTPTGLRGSFVSVEDIYKSQAASFNDATPSSSPNTSLPPSPSHPPQTRLPSMPERALTEIRPHSPAEQPQATSQRTNTMTPEQPTSPIRLQPRTYQPKHTPHQRDQSDASSHYSDHRYSFHDESKATNPTAVYNYSFPENSSRNSLALTTSKEQSRRPSEAGSLLASTSSHSNQTNDPRFSEFYDSYYRRSQLNPSEKTDGSKRPRDGKTTQPTIVEVPSPLPSPNPAITVDEPGAAL